MKINYILPSIFKSGGIRIIFEYANLLTRLGHDVTVYYPIIPQDFHRKDYSLSRVKKYITALIENLKNVIRKKYYDHEFNLKAVPYLGELFIRKADFTIATAWPTAFFVNQLKSDKGKKIYFIQDYEDWNSNLEQVDKSYLLPLIRITISNSLQELFKNKFGIDCYVIYNGLDRDKFYFENKTKNFNLKKILFIDHGLDKKNIRALIPIIEKLKISFPELEFVSFGLINHTAKPSFVKFYENPEDSVIRKLYNEADLFIYPSLSEGFGLPPAEAMACKCAVASTPVGAIPEYIVDGETGYIIKNRDLTDIPDIIRRIINDPVRLREVSNNGYNKVNEFFDWSKSVNKFIKYLSELNESQDIHHNS